MWRAFVFLVSGSPTDPRPVIPGRHEHWAASAGTSQPARLKRRANRPGSASSRMPSATTGAPDKPRVRSGLAQPRFVPVLPRFGLSRLQSVPALPRFVLPLSALSMHPGPGAVPPPALWYSSHRPRRHPISSPSRPARPAAFRAWPSARHRDRAEGESSGQTVGGPSGESSPSRSAGRWASTWATSLRHRAPERGPDRRCLSDAATCAGQP